MIFFVIDDAAMPCEVNKRDFSEASKIYSFSFSELIINFLYSAFIQESRVDFIKKCCSKTQGNRRLAANLLTVCYKGLILSKRCFCQNMFFRRTSCFQNK